MVPLSFHPPSTYVGAIHMNPLRTSCSILICLQLSANLSAFAQAFTPPPPRITPQPVFNAPAAIQIQSAPQAAPTSSLTPAPLVNIVTPVNLSGFTIPTGTILPTDSLSHSLRLHYSQAGKSGGAVNAGKPGPQRVVDIDDIKSFLSKNEWTHGLAEPWLERLDIMSAPSEEIGSIEAESQYLPIAYTQAPTDSRDIPMLLKLGSLYRELQIFSEPNQLLLEEDTVITGTPGTILSSHPTFFTLHAGSLIADTGATPGKIATRLGGIKIEPNSVCEIVYDPGKRLLIRAVQGNGIVARCKFSTLTDKVVEAKVGEQISIDLANQGIHDAERIVYEKCASSELQECLATHKFCGHEAKLMERLRAHVANGITSRATGASHEAKCVPSAPLHLVASENDHPKWRRHRVLQIRVSAEW